MPYRSRYRNFQLVLTLIFLEVATCHTVRGIVTTMTLGRFAVPFQLQHAIPFAVS